MPKTIKNILIHRTRRMCEYLVQGKNKLADQELAQAEAELEQWRKEQVPSVDELVEAICSVGIGEVDNPELQAKAVHSLLTERGKAE